MYYYQPSLAQLYTSLRMKNIETMLEVICDRLDGLECNAGHSLFTNQATNCGLAGGALFLAPVFAPFIVYVLVFCFVYWFISGFLLVTGTEPDYDTLVVRATDEDNKSESIKPE